MKLKSNVTTPAFLQAVQHCNGDVYFVTEEGDSLNLKSALSQFIFAAVVAGKLQKPDGEIVLEDPQDALHLRDYCD